MRRVFLLCFIALVAHYSTAQSSATCAAEVASGTSLVTGLTGLTYTDTTVTDGQAYDYMVTANDPYGFSCSNIVFNLTIPTSGTHSVTLGWAASPTPGVTYSVFRAQTPSAPGTLTGVVN